MITSKQFSEVISITLEAGKAILDVYNSDNQGIVIKKDSSPLTLADRASHDIITRGLQSISAWPQLSEEGRTIPYEQRENWTTFWLIDPLDGTKEFIKKNGEFTVNIALIHEGAPVVGIVYCPVLRKLYYGSKETGSFVVENTGSDNSVELDDVLKTAQRLPITGQQDIFTIVASRSHANQETEQFIKKIQDEHGEIRIISRGSSLKLCMVAEGTAELYPRLGPTMEWDTAAAHAVVAYAGGTVLRFDNNKSLLYNKPDLLNPFFIVSRAKAHLQ